MRKLYVLYDATCGFCWNCRGWLQKQPAFIELVFIASRSPEVLRRFPDLREVKNITAGSWKSPTNSAERANSLPAPATTFIGTWKSPNNSAECTGPACGCQTRADKDELIVISDEGGVYRGPAAFIMCLYALEEYRDWAEWLASPVLQPFARQGFEMLSKNRRLLSDWFHLGGEKFLATKLQTMAKPA